MISVCDLKQAPGPAKSGISSDTHPMADPVPHFLFRVLSGIFLCIYCGERRVSIESPDEYRTVPTRLNSDWALLVLFSAVATHPDARRVAADE